MIKRCLTVLMIGFISLSAEASNQVGVNIAISVEPPPPPAHIVMSAPKGYTRCYMTQGLWSNGIWIPAHQECVYAKSGSSSLWVSGYWGCLSASPNGHCARWKWNSNQWRGAPGNELHGHPQNPGYNQNIHQHKMGRLPERAYRDVTREVQVHGHGVNSHRDHQGAHHH